MNEPVYFELDDGTEIEFDRAEIAVMTNVDKLRDWYNKLNEATQDMVALGSGFKAVGHVDKSLGAKIGFYKMALNWLEKRLAELDVDLFHTKREANLARENKALREHVDRLARELNILKAVALQ